MVLDVVVIGAGQAGLSMGYYLQKSALSFQILDRSQRIGDVWRNRYDSLVLFTPRSYSSLHGLALDGDPEGFPTKDEIGDYLERYAATFELPIQLETEVTSLTKQDDLFVIQTNDSILHAKNVVVATGPFQQANIPSFAQDISKDVLQLHSSQYQNPSQLRAGPVLVVGGGNSGSQIAVEVSESHETYLSVGQTIRFLPLRLANKSIFWWLDKLGILRAHHSSFIGKKLQKQGDPIFGSELKEKISKGQVIVKGRTAKAHHDEIAFEDQSSLKVSTIIWATGFRADYSWITLPHLTNPNGTVLHQRGITQIEGLYFLGLPWQYRRGSALLVGVGDDAHYIYEHIIRNRTHTLSTSK